MPTAKSPLAAKPQHFPAKAKNVISIFCYGGVSQVDTFDPKPELLKRQGEKMTGVGFANDQSVTVIGTSRSGSEKTVRVAGEALHKHIVHRARKGCLLPGKIVPHSVKP